MRRAYQKTAIKISIVGAVTLALIVLTLSTLLAAAQPAQIDGRVEHIQPGRALVAGEAGLPPAVPLLGQAKAITSTPGVITQATFIEPGLSPGDRFPPGMPSVSVQRPPLPGWVAELMDVDDSGVIGSNSLIVSKSAKSSVFNGGTITYTITITNNSDQTINNIFIRDVLPENALDNVRCTGGCQLISATTTIEPRGSAPITIEATSQISWFVGSLTPAEKSVTKMFSATVRCQPDGADLTNSVFVLSDQGSGSALADTTVRVLYEPGVTSLSDEATWCSTEPGFAYDVAWGDFDGDGDLDLALGSYLGVMVYRNDEGRLTRLRQVHDRPTMGVRWADFDNDGTLELLATGQWHWLGSPHPDGGTYGYTGYNYIYKYNGSGFQLIDDNRDGYTFMSNDGVYRAAIADYDGDGDLDLATANFWGGCNLLLYKNQGPDQPGKFLETLPYVFTSSEHIKCLLSTPCCGLSSDFNTFDVDWGDYDNDGDPDLAAGLRASIRVFRNSGGNLTEAALIGITSEAYDLAWGDYDGDGYLDLAAAFPYRKQVLIYRNMKGAGFASPMTITTASFYDVPYSIDWGDFNRDGDLDLVVAEPSPTIYSPGIATTPIITLPASVVPSRYGQYYQVRSIRGADYDNDGDLDLALSNYYGQSLLLTTFAPPLNTTLSQIGSRPAGSVAWGDADGDGDLDLLFGAGLSSAGSPDFGSGLYYNDKGTFPAGDMQLILGFGPRSVAFGDVDDDGDLDMAFGTNGQNEVYHAGNTGTPDWESEPSFPSHSVAWGDAGFDDHDGGLDLLVGNDGPNALYLNLGTELASTPVWTSSHEDDTRSVAWGDFDNDHYLDFAAGNYGQPNRVYRNNQDNTFTPVWTSASVLSTTSVAWGDYDGDGDLDLAVGNYGAANSIYENLNGTLNSEPIWTSQELSNTTSLAWGDWDNDGDPDLAVGNDGQPDQVYTNLSTPDAPELRWLWTSEKPYRTSGVAWGDKDGDGDLDLAVSHNGESINGVYENLYVSPSHLQDDFATTMPLPNNPTYLSIARPGDTDVAYFNSSADLLSGPVNPTVTVRFTLFDPDGSRAKTDFDAYGDDVITGSTRYEFSLDGCNDWQPATGRLESGPGDGSGMEDTRRLGQAYAFLWNAQQDEAIGDNARFRIRVVNYIGSVDADGPNKRAGLTQRASTSAISPPFRVRGLSCQWPDGLSIWVDPQHPEVGEAVRMEGNAAAGSGVLTFTWDFGDTLTAAGQVVQHTYAANNTYVVTLTVSGEPCPITEPAVVTETVVVGTGTLDKLVYLPLILKSSSAGTTVSTRLVQPAQVAGLSGSSQPGDGVTHLAWKHNDASEAITGYRIYRHLRTKEGAFQLLATVPTSLTTYTDDTAACGYAYYVTAFNPVGESPASTASFFSLPCER